MAPTLGVRVPHTLPKIVFELESLVEVAGAANAARSKHELAGGGVVMVDGLQ